MNTGKDSKWFPHDSDALDDPKIMLLVMQFGMEGYGLYWMLIECLMKQPGYMLPVNLIEPLSRRFQVSKEKLETIVSKYDLFEVNGEYFSSQSLLRRMEMYNKRTETNRKNAIKRWGARKNAIALPSYSDCNAIREEKITKDKRRKQNKTKEENTLFSLSFCSYPFKPVWEKWIEYKRKLGKPYKTIEGMQAKYNHLVKLSGGNAGIALQIVDRAIREEWAGLYAIKNFSSEPIPGEDPVQKTIREMKESVKEKDSL